MNEPLMHATMALAVKCAQATPCPTRAQTMIFAEEIATEMKLVPEAREMLLTFAKEHRREGMTRVIRLQLVPTLDPMDRREGDLRPDGSVSLLGIARIVGRLRRLGAAVEIIEWEPGDLAEGHALTPQGQERLETVLAAQSMVERWSNFYGSCPDDDELEDESNLCEDAKAVSMDLAREATRVRAILLEALRTAPNMPWPQLRDEVLRMLDVVDPEAIMNDVLDPQKAD